ncbi:NifX-associated nitrogen fixation protein [Martelella sp. HB161492]|uniref:NifX-associated nitrogen fixation protein n=1 Tax=Martelella sp. HB161492 TaxID=2720726 RepID=UPI001590EEA7|nr:NifX-associated nitrogen fixation protein [Martelella sp. HB161492]
MTETAPLATASPAITSPDGEMTSFMKSLVQLMRAQDVYDTWEGRSDASILEDYIVTKAQRKVIPIIGDPDPDVLWRLEIYYSAIGLAIEKETGIIASPMMKMHHEGFGRVLLTCGRLVVLVKSLRDVHRFGFESLEKMDEAGSKLVAEAAAMVATWPDVAKL